MATYKEIQQTVRDIAGNVPKTCWIAHVLSDHGLTNRQAANRIDSRERTNPCPPEKRPSLEKALRLHRMI